MSRLQISVLLAATSLIAAALPPPVPTSGKTDIDARVDAIVAAGKAKTSIAEPRCGVTDNTDAIVVCGDRDADTRYRQAEDFREKRTAIRGGVPDAPNVSFAPPCLAFCRTMTFGGTVEAPPPYTAGQLPVVDQEYLERARKAEAQERLRAPPGKEP